MFSKKIKLESLKNRKEKLENKSEIPYKIINKIKRRIRRMEK